MFRTQRLAILLLVAAVTLGSFGANAATTRYVRTDGNHGYYLNFYWGRVFIVNVCNNGDNPCRHINDAIKYASRGDLIKVAQGTYRESLHVRAYGTSRYPNKTNVVIQGGWSQDFTTHDDNFTRTTIWNSAGQPHRFTASSSASGDLGLTFEDLEFRLSADSAMQITSGNVSNDFGTYTSWRKRGQVTLTLRNVHLQGSEDWLYQTSSSIDATSGRYSYLTLNLIDVHGNARIKASSRSYTGIPSLADPDWSRLTLNVRRSRIHGIYERGRGLDVLARGSGAEAVVSVKESVVRHIDGAGVYADVEEGGLVSLDIENSFLVENEGYGLDVHGGIDANVRYSTISGNEAGGIFTDGGEMNLTNTIVWGNVSSSSYRSVWDLKVSGGTASASDSDVGGVFVASWAVYEEGPGVVDVDPRFDRLGVEEWAANGFHLKGDSPLIDRGICGDGDEYDFDGDERPLGKSCEIGADEVLGLAVSTTPFKSWSWSWGR